MGDDTTTDTDAKIADVRHAIAGLVQAFQTMIDVARPGLEALYRAWYEANPEPARQRRRRRKVVRS